MSCVDCDLFLKPPDNTLLWRNWRAVVGMYHGVLTQNQYLLYGSSTHNAVNGGAMYITAAYYTVINTLAGAARHRSREKASSWLKPVHDDILKAVYTLRTKYNYFGDAADDVPVLQAALYMLKLTDAPATLTPHRAIVVIDPYTDFMWRYMDVTACQHPESVWNACLAHNGLNYNLDGLNYNLEAPCARRNNMPFSGPQFDAFTACWEVGAFRQAYAMLDKACDEEEHDNGDYWLVKGLRL